MDTFILIAARYFYYSILFISMIFVRTSCSQTEFVKGVFEETRVTISTQNVFFEAGQASDLQPDSLGYLMQRNRVSSISVQQKSLEAILKTESGEAQLNVDLPYLKESQVFSAVPTGDPAIDSLDPALRMNEPVINWIRHVTRSAQACFHLSNNTGSAYSEKDAGKIIDISSCPYIEPFPYQADVYHLEFDSHLHRLKISFSEGAPLLVDLQRATHSSPFAVFAHNTSDLMYQAPGELKQTTGKIPKERVGATARYRPYPQQEYPQSYQEGQGSAASAAAGGSGGDDKKDKKFDKEKNTEKIKQAIIELLEEHPEGLIVKTIIFTLAKRNIGQATTLKSKVKKILRSEPEFRAQELVIQGEAKKWYLNE